MRDNPNMSVVDEFASTIKKETKNAKFSRTTSVIVLVALILVFSIFGRGFFTLSNLVAILNQMAIPLVVACGATFVVILGSMDLTVDGLMGLIGIITVILMDNSLTNIDLGVFGIIIALIIGATCGALVGFIQVKCKVPSFLLTNALSGVFTGIALLIYKGTPVLVKDTLLLSFAAKSFLGIPVLFWIALIVLAITYIIQEYTAFGRYVYAVGINEVAPKSAGVNITKVKVLVFMISGLCIGIGGVLGASRLTWGDLSIGTGNLFPVLTAVVVGGTSVSGGKGGVINTLIGVAIVTILENGLILAEVSPQIVDAVQGAIIIAAVAISIERKSHGYLLVK